jgi:hypothetical protein
VGSIKEEAYGLDQPGQKVRPPISQITITKRAGNKASNKAIKGFSNKA